MLSLPPLGKQLVHPRDSVLGSLSRAVLQPNGTIAGANGLNTTYTQMIRDAFQDNLWNSTQAVTLPEGQYIQMEANFSLFWGLAIQLYLATLVSDQTPFDRWLGGNAGAITDEQRFGFMLFNGIANCVVCHGGIEFTNASVATAAFVNNFDNALIDLMFVGDGTQVIYDNGFNNNAITPTTDDIARGGNTPFINPLTGQPYPLSFMHIAELQAQNLLPFNTFPVLEPIIPPNFPVNANGLFKVPGLRNVELTAPYFHNGSIMTLEEVMDVYTRGGNFPEANIHDIDPIIGEGLSLLQGKEDLHAAIIAFMKSLTDERVRNESAPFDHPELFVPEGDPEVLTRIPATDVDGNKATSTLTINPVVSPTTVSTQTISGTVEAGLTLTVTVDTTATAGTVTVVGTDWSCTISGLAAGANNITVSVTSGGVLTTFTSTIIFDATPPPVSPVAVNDSGTTNLNTGVVINVLANDSDPDGSLNPASVAKAHF